ncbi:MAG: alpha/beta hydrolase, partial [Pseudomonadota bacterium]
MSRQVLMVHGVGCGGEVWDRMRPVFEGAGFKCTAPTLFPELRTVERPDEAGAAKLGALTLEDYVEAMSETAQALAEAGGEGAPRPAIIGHSMGGLIAQKLAERGDVSAAVFLTPAAPAGCTVTDLRVARTFWSVVSKGRSRLPGKAVKVGRRGFGWGVLNQVERARH